MVVVANEQTDRPNGKGESFGTQQSQTSRLSRSRARLTPNLNLIDQSLSGLWYTHDSIHVRRIIYELNTDETIVRDTSCYLRIGDASDQNASEQCWHSLVTVFRIWIWVMV